MNRLLKFPALPALLACGLFQLGASVCAAAPDTAASLFADPVVATGKGFEIKRGEVDEAYINYSATLLRNGRSIADVDRPLIRSNLLQHLIINKILLQKATEEDKSKARQQVDDAINRARTNAPSPEAFEAQVKATGMTLAQWRDRTIENELCRLIRVRDLTNGIVIPATDVKKFYDGNPSKFERPERVRVAHILISIQDPVTKTLLPPEKRKGKYKLAGEARARAEKGEDFAALAKTYSDDLSSKGRGGEYTFGREETKLPEFEAAAFTLKVGQISDIVETQLGYHIIKLLEKIPASKEEFDKAAPAILDWLTEQEAEKALPAYVAKLKEGAAVKILDATMGP